MRWTILLVSACALAVTAEKRPKERDASGKEFVAITDIAGECSDSSYFGYGISPDGGLDLCENKTAADAGDTETKIKYQKFKCASLRVHGEFTDGECKCADKWKGPICNDYSGCPTGQALSNGVCATNICQNEGVLSVGSTQIECSCRVPWDGRFCERLACWRKASKEHERRWKNAGVECSCSEFYTGPECDKITKCKNGNLTEAGFCDCSENWMGEICDKKCYKGMECIKNTSGSESTLLISLASLLLLLLQRS